MLEKYPMLVWVLGIALGIALFLTGEGWVVGGVIPIRLVGAGAIVLFGFCLIFRIQPVHPGTQQRINPPDLGQYQPPTPFGAENDLPAATRSTSDSGSLTAVSREAGQELNALSKLMADGSEPTARLDD